IGSITLSADGQVAATTANDDNNIRLWNMATGEMLFELTHTDYVYNISFSPDGKLLRTGGFANIVHVWDVATGEEIYQFAGLWSQFSDDSQFLFATDQDQVVLRNAATGEEVHSFTTDDYVSSVRLTPDHTLLLVWLEDATIRLWGIPKEGETIPEITPEPIPGGEPKAGRWEGDYISFTLNVDGEITQLDMSVPFGGSYCDASFDNPDGHVTASGSLRVSITATDGAQIFIGGFDGRFDSSESISGTYSVSFCGNTMSFGGDSSWSSTWAGE
ncbi:MAG TPA: WD40 repeat domain-containing protein, partial [Aggregatilineaceae bacterium]|nr:WD40 repeat domain-containing protein [Aggregatilineaceae bacterium]